MNLRQLIQLLNREREPKRLSITSLWIRALTNGLTRGVNQRRIVGTEAKSQTESLEVRQVLSASNWQAAAVYEPAVFADPSAGDVPLLQEASSATENAFATDSLLQQLRVQLANVLSEAVFPESDETAATNGAARVSVMGDQLAITTLPPVVQPFVTVDESAATLKGTVRWSGEDLLTVQVVLGWDHGSQQVDVLGLSENDFQITLRGLGGTSLASAGEGVVEQLVYLTAFDVIQSVQPFRTPLISFSQPFEEEAFQPAAIRADSSPASSLAISAVTDFGFPEPSVTGSTNSGLPSEDADALSDSDESEFVSLIDDIFQDSSSVLDIVGQASGNLPLRVMAATKVESESLVRFQALASEQFSRLRQIDVDDSGSVAPGVVAAAHQKSSGKLIRRALGWLRPGKFSIVHKTELLIAQEVAGRIVATLEIGTESLAPPTVPGVADSGDEWLNWLLDSSSAGKSQVVTGQGQTPSPNSLPGAVPVLSEHGSALRGQSATSLSPQAQARKYRESLRQAAPLDGNLSVSFNEFDTPILPQSGSIPQELKYVAKPRGPPVYGRDADVPLNDWEAPADLLERLRYSIAPRGPSLVTEKMQSPECQFSSGPRVSPEKLQFDLAR